MAKDSNKYVGAPYNFVPLYKSVYKRYKKTDELPEQNKIRDDLYSGEIEYEFVNKTPIFISNGEEKENIDFYKNLRGKYAVPGSTMRGLIENNITVLGFCGVGGDIANRKYMYRRIGDNKGLRNLYSKNLGVGTKDGRIVFNNAVKAGYVKCIKGKYYFYPTVDEKIKNSGSNFYSVRETDVWKDIDNFSYIKDKLMYISGNFYAEEIKRKNPKADSKNLFRVRNNDLNSEYKPYFEKICYSVNDNKVTGIFDPAKANDEEGLHKGWVISSGRINNEKKTFYVIPDINEEYRGKIDDLMAISYKDNIKVNETVLGKNKLFYSLPEENECKPVFYKGSLCEGTDENDKSYIQAFGFTPMLRLFHEHSIYDAVPKEHLEAKDSLNIDYRKAMFGFIKNIKNKPFAYKSRVYFEDAETNCKKTQEKIKMPPAGPKASSYMDYIKGGKHYSEDGIEIRGIKQYWLRDKVDYEGMKKGKITDKFCQELKPVDSNNLFKGKIRFKNLQRDELGLLLWALRLENNYNENRITYNMNAGMGKAYGFGRIEFIDIKLKLYDYSKMYKMESLNFDVFDDDRDKENIDKFIEYYKNHIMEKFIDKDGGNKKGNIRNIPSVKALLDMKNIKSMPDPKYIRYMTLEEYKDREALETVDDIIKRANKNRSKGDNKFNKGDKENTNNKDKGMIKGLKGLKDLKF